jgi:hypothetical protein
MKVYVQIQLILASLFLSLVIPEALGDNVTVHGTVGLLEAQLVTKDLSPVGTVEVWNTEMDLNIIVTPNSGLVLSKVYVYMDTEPAPAPFPDEPELLIQEYDAAVEECVVQVEACEAELIACEPLLENDPNDPVYLAALAEYEAAVQDYQEACDTRAELAELLLQYPELIIEPDFGDWFDGVNYKKDVPLSYSLTAHLSEIAGLQWGQWGEPWLQKRLVTIAVRVELKIADSKNTLTTWAMNPKVPLDSQQTAWGENCLAMRYELQHPKQGTFVGPVHGLGYSTPTHGGIIGTEGGFSFFPGETVDLYIGDIFIGSAPAAQRISPLDIFPSQEISDAAVINLARLLISLDGDGDSTGPITITAAMAATLQQTMDTLGLVVLDFTSTGQIDELIAYLGGVSTEDALAWLENSAGSKVMRRNVSKSPEYAVDKPKLDIMPVWVPARTANGLPATIDYKDQDGNMIETRDRAKPLFVTYTEKQQPNPEAGITRSGSDIITAVSMDDGATWKRFNVSHMARKSSFTLETGEKFPGDSRGPRQKIVDDKIMVVWTSAYARGGKPSFAIKTDDDYPYDDAYAVNDVWGVRGKQGSVNYDEDKDVGDQGIGEIPYYALWTCRGVLVWEGNADKFPDRQIGEVVWFKPERLTSGRRDAFFAMMGGARNVGFAVAWQEDPGGLLPGSCKGGGDGWSGATVHKKTDIWYSYIKDADFELIDENWDPDANHSGDELSEGGPDEHGQQPEISNRPKWLVPMSLPVRVSDNSVVNTENLKVQLDPDSGLPVIDPNTGSYIPLDGAIEEDYLATEHEGEGGCDDGDDDGDGEHDGHSGRGGGWGMARYAYELPQLGILDMDPANSEASIWDEEIDGDYRPYSGLRWTRFINKPGAVKTVAVTADGRELDGNTGACRPSLQLMSGGWVILGYEETKGLGVPPEGEHGEDDDTDRPEPDDKGKNIIYHSFKFNQPDRVSAGNVLNLPALDDEGNLIPIFYKDAEGLPTEDFRQYKTEVARRVRFIAQPKSQIGPSRTIMLATYKQGREGSGKPSDVFVVRGVVPDTDTKYDNPYRFDNLQRLDTSEPNPDDYGYNRYQRKHMNMSAATVEVMDPVEKAGDGEGNTWNKVGKWKQYGGNMSDESFANPFSDAKAHRGFIRGDRIVFGYSFTPNWGRLGGDHMDFYVRRSFDGGQSWTTDPDGPEEVVHTVIEREPDTGEFIKKQYQYQRGAFEPGRNVSLLKGNSQTVVDPRLVPPMREGSTVNKTYPQDDTEAPDVYYVAFGTAKVLHGIGEPLGVTDTEKEDVFYSRTTDAGSTWLQVPWVINPDSSSPDAGETVYRWPWLAHGAPHQGHAQVRMHPAGNRFYAIWHQWTDGDEWPLSPHDIGNDIWFRRIDFMEPITP